MQGAVARRYASAIAESALERGEQALDLCTKELEELARLTVESKELRAFLESPAFTVVERQKALAALLDKLGTSPLTRRFLTLLGERNRFPHLEAIAKELRRLADQRAGRVRAEVLSASPLSQDATDSLRRALEKRTGRHVDLDVKIDPSLLGGVRAQIGSTVLDGTLRSQLAALRERLLRAE